MPDVDVFSALANPVRREILMQLRRGPRAVTDLAQHFEIGRPAVSEHLQVLRKARLVKEQPRGRERYYHLDPRPLAEVEAWLHAFTRYWEQRMDARLLRYRFATGTLDTIITWQLAPEGEGTRLTLTHEGFDLDSPLGWQAFEGMRRGWPKVLERMSSAL